MARKKEEEEIKTDLVERHIFGSDESAPVFFRAVVLYVFCG